jgi:phosphatidylinositol alpha-1,6-mannosyltransferase
MTADFPPDFGGLQLLAHRLATCLEGLEVRVVAPAAAGAAGYDAASGVSTRRAPRAPGPSAARVLSLNAVALVEALRFRPDVVLCVHIVLSPAAAATRRLLGVPLVQYFHGNEIAGKPRLAARAAGAADVALAISSYTAELIRGTGAEPRDLRVIPPGVDLPVDPSPLPEPRPTVLTVARLKDAYKGHDVLIRAMPRVRERVPDVQWVVIGDGPLRAPLEALARSSGLGGCARFLGAVPDEQRDSWLRRADVFAMPSRLPGGGLAGEGFGIVFTEAGAYGKPVVGGNVGGALDAVLDGETGLLVDPEDAEAVADAVSSLLLDRELAGRLGAAGARRARELSWAAICARVQAVLLERAPR